MCARGCLRMRHGGKEWTPPRPPCGAQLPPRVPRSLEFRQRSNHSPHPPLFFSAAPATLALALALLLSLPPPTTAVASVTVDRYANVLARSDYAVNGSLVPPPADPTTITFTLVAGGAPHAPSDAAVAAAVAMGAGVTPANIALTVTTNPAACADVCRAWDVRVKPADATAAARLRVSLDAGANRSILRRVLETTRADAATYNYVGGLVEGDRSADIVTELGGAAGAGGLAPGAIAGIVVGGVVCLGAVAAVVGVVVVRRRARGARWVGAA